WEFGRGGEGEGGIEKAEGRMARTGAQKDSQIGKSALHGEGVPSALCRTGIWFNGKVVDLDLREIELSGDEVVRLWHPIGKEIEEVLAWREWLDTQQIQQPFKQAHREVYV